MDSDYMMSLRKQMAKSPNKTERDIAHGHTWKDFLASCVEEGSSRLSYPKIREFQKMIDNKEMKELIIKRIEERNTDRLDFFKEFVRTVGTEDVLDKICSDEHNKKVLRKMFKPALESVLEMDIFEALKEIIGDTDEDAKNE